MISVNLSKIIERIAGAAKRADRNPEDGLLVAASKGVGVDRLKEGLSAGIRVFGESKVQDAMPKLQALGNKAEWHFIGHLQGNKVQYVVGAFSLIHSVDSIELSEEINRRAEQMGLIKNVLLEVNVSGEEGKFGVMPDKAISITKAFSVLRYISLRGFMTVPPYSDDPEDARPYFKMLREIRDNVRNTNIGSGHCGELSMGMSGDFEAEIA